ncbi:MAG: hypothetical protein M3203_02130 [Actinomycetota bacterium]|nr:hypothetical protein [Actinomycetota bacterium]
MITGLAIAATVMLAASAIWACVAVFSFTSMSSSVQPGGTVTVIGRGFAQGAPVDIHLGSPTGPILATAPPPNTTMTSQFVLAVTIPEDTPIGPHVLVAHQKYHDMNAGGPTRAMIHVGAAPPVAPPPEPERPAAVAIAEGRSIAALAAIGLATAAGSVLLAVLASMALRSRPAATATHA